MSIFILFDTNHIKKLYHHIIIFGLDDFALKTFFHNDHVIFSTNIGIDSDNQEA